MKTQLKAWLICAVYLCDPVVQAGEPDARVQNVAGVLLSRQQGKPWQPAKAGDALLAGTQVVALPRTEIVSANAAVQVDLLADVGKRGPLAVLESAVTVHRAKDVDADIALDRGLIVVTNLKKAGEAKVRLRVWNETWLLTLHDPQTRIAVEIYGRLQAGIPTDLTKIHPPVAEVMGLLLRGEAFLELEGRGTGLRQPPGTAGFAWDSLSKQVRVRRLEKLPEAIVKPLNDHEDKDFQEIVKCSAGLDKLGLEDWLKKLVQGDSATCRALGITWAGAVDDLPLVVGVLESSTHAADRDHAVLALRHWLGREPGQVQKMYDLMIGVRKLSEVQARSSLQLLIGFDEDEKGRPETYEMLIHYLRHSKQAVRELAHWHLVRLVPEGRTIAYDASSPEAARMQAYERWQALIPEGKLPKQTRTP